MTKENITDEKDRRIAELEAQVRSVEVFANMVVEQRNAAQNEAAQYRTQMIIMQQQGAANAS